MSLNGDSSTRHVKRERSQTVSDHLDLLKEEKKASFFSMAKRKLSKQIFASFHKSKSTSSLKKPHFTFEENFNPLESSGHSSPEDSDFSDSLDVPTIPAIKVPPIVQQQTSVETIKEALWMSTIQKSNELMNQRRAKSTGSLGLSYYYENRDETDSGRSDKLLSPTDKARKKGFLRTAKHTFSTVDEFAQMGKDTLLRIQDATAAVQLITGHASNNSIPATLSQIQTHLADSSRVISQSFTQVADSVTKLQRSHQQTLTKVEEKLDLEAVSRQLQVLLLCLSLLIVTVVISSCQFLWRSSFVQQISHCCLLILMFLLFLKLIYILVIK